MLPDGRSLRLLTVSLLAMSHAPFPAAAQEPTKPNIVILLADDLGWDDVGYHGSEVATPHIDTLVQEGVELHRFYVQPNCSPTRAGLMTGRYPLRFGMQRNVIWPWETHGLPAEEETLAEMLATAGYRRRAIFGKWHLGHAERRYHPLNQGFTEFFGHYNGSVDYFLHVRGGPTDRQGEHDLHRDFEPTYVHGYLTDLVADEAVRFIREAKEEEPFFLYVPFLAPHTPNQALLLDMLPYIPLGYPRMTHAAMITALDRAIGRILGVLEEEGLTDNTLVWFLSDNGGDTDHGASNRPLRGQKRDLFEGGIRVPAAVRWPAGVEGGRRVDAVTGYIDVLPTLRRISGAPPIEGNEPDGADLLDLLRGTAPPPQRDWFAYTLRPDLRQSLSVTTSEWKLVRTGTPIQDQGEDKSEMWLFRVSDEPDETTNLAAQHPQVVDALLVKLRAFREQRSAGGVGRIRRPPAGWEPPAEWRIPD